MLARWLFAAALVGAAPQARLLGQASDSSLTIDGRRTGVAVAPRDSLGVALDSLVALAVVASPTLRAARSRLDAAQARVAPAGARPDPMLMAGVQNVPVTQPAAADDMTMRMVGVSQTIPYPGKLAHQEAAASREADMAARLLEAARLEVARQVIDAYYDVAYAGHALEIVVRHQRVLTELARVAQTHYAAGAGTQVDVLRARFEVAQLARSASALAEDRRAALARLNALLDQPSETPIGDVSFPSALRRLASPDSGAPVHFTTPSAGARAADSPLLPLDSIQARAAGASPMIRAHEAAIAAQRDRVALARKAHLPDVDVSLAYGQRPGLSDMVTAMVSVPLPLQRGRRQKRDVAATVADLEALTAEHHEKVNVLHAEIAARYADAERARTELAIVAAALLPQARATLESATASFRVGRTGFQAVADAQAMVFHTETAYHRALADFGRALAALEQLAGAEVLR